MGRYEASQFLPRTMFMIENHKAAVESSNVALGFLNLAEIGDQKSNQKLGRTS